MPPQTNERVVAFGSMLVEFSRLTTFSERNYSIVEGFVFLIKDRYLIF